MDRQSGWWGMEERIGNSASCRAQEIAISAVIYYSRFATVAARPDSRTIDKPFASRFIHAGHPINPT